MADTNNNLPEGTDTIIGGASGTSGSDGGTGRSGTGSGGFGTSGATNSTGGRTTTTASDNTDALITAGGSSSGAASSGSSTGGSTSGDSNDSSSKGGVRGIVSNVTGKAKDEVGNRARGAVSQGLERGSATLGNVATLIEDTVEQIGEKLGPQYADYARTASQTINRYATSLQDKDPDELVDDARNIIRKSPGVAIAGAAIIGFGLVRLLKAGIPEEGSDGTRDRQSDRAGSTR